MFFFEKCQHAVKCFEPTGSDSKMIETRCSDMFLPKGGHPSGAAESRLPQMGGHLVAKINMHTSFHFYEIINFTKFTKLNQKTLMNPGYEGNQNDARKQLRFARVQRCPLFLENAMSKT